MKAIVYSARKNERDMFMLAGARKHELIWESVPLSLDTVHLAAGQQAIIVFANDEVSCTVIAKLADLGVKFILTRSSGLDHIDLKAAEKYAIEVKNIPNYSAYAVAEHAVMLALALSRHLINAIRNCTDYDFSISLATGFNIHGKTVGIIGMGHIGKVAGKIFHGFGCRVLGYDIDPTAVNGEMERVDLQYLLKHCDIISLHVPLNDSSYRMINRESISAMKHGMMLINTARGALVNTTELLAALDAGKIGYYGADVYEFEKGLFFEDHETDQVRDPLLNRLMAHPNVLLTPHQAFLTAEALADIAKQSVQYLEEWEKQLKGGAALV